MTIQNQTTLSPDLQAVIDRVAEAAEKKKGEIFAGVDARNSVLDEKLSRLLALHQAAGQVAAAPLPNGVAGPAIPAAQPQAPQPQGPGLLTRVRTTLGFGTGFEPRPVGIDRKHALAMVAAGMNTPELASITDAGLQALAIDAAFRAKIVKGPQTGLTAWQTVGLVAGGAALVGGAVAGTMYVTETGFFKPEPAAE